MERREFIQKSTLAAMTIPEILRGKSVDSNKMGVVVHSYGARYGSKVASQKYPAFNNAIDLMEHCKSIGAGGIQVVIKDWAEDFSKKVREKREKYEMYLEGSIQLPKTADGVAQFDKDVKAAKEAGASIIRTVSLGGRRYEVFHKNGEYQEFQKKAIEAIRLAEPILQKYKMKLGIENHKDWRADELVKVMQLIDSEWIGVTLDFGNSIALLEDPMKVVETLAPYSFSSHIKDMALDEYQNGFLLAEVPMGTGILNLKKMVELCLKHNSKIKFNLEMITRDPLEIPCITADYWPSMEGIPAIDLANTLKLVKDKKSAKPIPKISPLSPEEKLAIEEKNIVDSFAFAKSLGL
ncbi:MAG: TIM barrel protein [Bacteroidota bacterium]